MAGQKQNGPGLKYTYISMVYSGEPFRLNYTILFMDYNYDVIDGPHSVEREALSFATSSPSSVINIHVMHDFKNTEPKKCTISICVSRIAAVSWSITSVRSFTVLSQLTIHTNGMERGFRSRRAAYWIFSSYLFPIRHLPHIYLSYVRCSNHVAMGHHHQLYRYSVQSIRFDFAVVVGKREYA